MPRSGCLALHGVNPNLKKKKIAKPDDWAGSKWDVDEFDKWKTTAIDFSKLSSSVKSDVVKKTIYIELIKIFNAIQTIGASGKTFIS